VAQMNADTHLANLVQVSSQPEYNRGSSVQSKLVACEPPGIRAKNSDSSLGRRCSDGAEK
jgi:hypothetical protein